MPAIIVTDEDRRKTLMQSWHVKRKDLASRDGFQVEIWPSWHLKPSFTMDFTVDGSQESMYLSAKCAFARDGQGEARRKVEYNPSSSALTKLFDEFPAQKWEEESKRDDVVATTISNIYEDALSRDWKIIVDAVSGHLEKWQTELHMLEGNVEKPAGSDVQVPGGYDGITDEAATTEGP